MQSDSSGKKEPSESLGIGNVVSSTFISPYRLWANPYTPTYATITNDKDWNILRNAPHPFHLNCANSCYERLCIRPIHHYHSKGRATLTSVKWFPDFRRLMTTTTSGELCVFSSDFCKLEDIKRLPGSAGPLTSLEWLPDETVILTGDWGGTVHLSSPTLSPIGSLKDLLGHSIIDISPSPTSLKIAATATDAHPIIWDLYQQTKERSLSALGFDISCLQWHPQQGLVATGSKSDQLAFWDPRSATPIKVIMGHKGALTSLRFSPDGKFLATAGRDSLIRIWDLATLLCYKQFRYSPDSDRRITSLRWNPIMTSRFLVSGDSGGTIAHYDLTLISESFNSVSKQCEYYPHLVRCNDAHEQSISSLEFHSSGRALASVGADGIIRIWVPPVQGSITSAVSSYALSNDTSFRPSKIHAT